MVGASSRSLSSLEKYLFPIALAIGWLLPNHYQPWTTFHTDAWVSAVLLVLSGLLLFRSNCAIYWGRAAWILLAVAVLPLIQYGCGLILFSGTMWLSTEYLLGLLLAYLIGARLSPKQAYEVADVLFTAIGLAALLSVFLQLNQWLQTDDYVVWAMRFDQARPSANFGQPNQCGSFLLWGGLAVVWGVARRKISAFPALLMGALLLFGVALTGSRTAWIGLVVLAVATWRWRSIWKHKYLPHIVFGLGFYFMTCIFAIHAMGAMDAGVATGAQPNMANLTRMSGELRPQIWSMFLDAIGHKPWTGYGWSQGQLAQLEVAVNHSPLYILSPSAHNVFLDLMVWCGIPIGILICLSIVLWLGKRFLLVQNAEDTVLIGCLLVIGNHAMLELPLQYAYILLPVGLMAGLLDASMRQSDIFTMERWSAAMVWIICAGLLILIGIDYIKVEENFRVLQFQRANIKGSDSEKVSDGYLLTQFNGYFRVARTVEGSGIGAEAMAESQRVASMYPGSYIVYKHAKMLALNGRPAEAKNWLMKMCQMISEAECSSTKKTWDTEADKFPDMLSVDW